MAERLLAKGEVGQHQCDRCLKLFDFVGNGQWIPTTCPECKASKYRVYLTNFGWYSGEHATLEAAIEAGKDGGFDFRVDSANGEPVASWSVIGGLRYYRQSN